MNSLIIGDKSQLSYYFPKEYERVSGKNLDLSFYEDKFYDRVFITFAEQRLNEIKDFSTYIDTNTMLTLKMVEFFRHRANFVIVYGSCELWNNYNGEIDINDKFDYDVNSAYTGYCVSKHMMVEQIHDLKTDNVFILHPFNFNPGFLFSKIFDSVKNRTKIEIGDTYFYRDMVHPKYVVERSIMSQSDEVIGSGRLTFVNDFIRKLYAVYGLHYEDYVTENINANIIPKKKILYLRSKEAKYTNLLEDTLDDIRL